MAFPSGALILSSSLMLILVAFPVPDVHANSWRHAAPNVAGGGGNIRNKAQASSKHHRPKFQPSPWKDAHATFYEGDSGSFGIYQHFLIHCNHPIMFEQTIPILKHPKNLLRIYSSFFFLSLLLSYISYDFFSLRRISITFPHSCILSGLINI